MEPPVFRFAPSPNGLLHLGHAYSALLNLDLAAEAGGKLLVRLEDIDTTRCRESYVGQMLDDLAWLGLPTDRPRRQSEHFADYAAALDKLAGKGLLYPSRATRRDIAAAVTRLDQAGRWPRDPDGAPHFPRGRVIEDPAEPEALRLDMARAMAGLSLTWTETGAGPQSETGTITADPAAWGDAILRRKEFPASYAIAVVVDDALQGITHVVRGQDLFHATSLQRLLQHHLGLAQPIYHHHRLVRGAEGEKLSKSLASTALKTFRAEGKSVGDLRRLLGLPDR